MIFSSGSLRFPSHIIKIKPAYVLAGGHNTNRQSAIHRERELPICPVGSGSASHSRPKSSSSESAIESAMTKQEAKGSGLLKNRESPDQGRQELSVPIAWDHLLARNQDQKDPGT